MWYKYNKRSCSELINTDFKKTNILYFYLIVIKSIFKQILMCGICLNKLFITINVIYKIIFTCTCNAA